MSWSQDGCDCDQCQGKLSLSEKGKKCSEKYSPDSCFSVTGEEGSPNKSEDNPRGKKQTTEWSADGGARGIKHSVIIQEPVGLEETYPLKYPIFEYIKEVERKCEGGECVSINLHPTEALTGTDTDEVKKDDNSGDSDIGTKARGEGGDDQVGLYLGPAWLTAATLWPCGANIRAEDISLAAPVQNDKKVDNGVKCNKKGKKYEESIEKSNKIVNSQSIFNDSDVNVVEEVPEPEGVSSIKIYDVNRVHNHVPTRCLSCHMDHSAGPWCSTNVINTHRQVFNRVSQIIWGVRFWSHQTSTLDFGKGSWWTMRTT